MPLFRKKPVVIEAVHVVDLLNAASRDWAALPEWIKSAYEAGDVLFLADSMEIKSREGWVTGTKHHWALKGVDDELYFCDSDIFAKTYEDVEEGVVA